MEHSVTYTMDDGTEYRLTYDNETGVGESMHYLLHENGVLKLECTHHRLPGDLTEDDFKSVIIPGSFFTCLGRNIEATLQRQAIESLDEDDPMRKMLPLIRDHVQLKPHESEYLTTVVERGHSVELFVKLAQEAEVERFSRELNQDPAEMDADRGVISTDGGKTFRKATPEELELIADALTGKLVQAEPKAPAVSHWPAIVWALFVVAGIAAYLLLVG